MLRLVTFETEHYNSVIIIYGKPILTMHEHFELLEVLGWAIKMNLTVTLIVLVCIVLNRFFEPVKH